MERILLEFFCAYYELFEKCGILIKAGQNVTEEILV